MWGPAIKMGILGKMGQFPSVRHEGVHVSQRQVIFLGLSPALASPPEAHTVFPPGLRERVTSEMTRTLSDQLGDVHFQQCAEPQTSF